MTENNQTKSGNQREHYKESIKWSWFFEKTIKIDKPLSKLIKRNRENIQINKTRKKKGVIAKDTEEIQRLNRSYF